MPEQGQPDIYRWRLPQGLAAGLVPAGLTLSLLLFVLVSFAQKISDNTNWYYGWLIVAVCAVTLLVAFGIRLSFTVFFVAFLDEFGWSRASTAFIFSLSMVVFTLLSTPAGMALDRWGTRRVFGVGAVLIAVGLLLSSQIHSFNQLILSYGLVTGAGITILGLGPQASVIARWFRHYRGVAIGLAFAGTGFGTLLLTPGTEFLIGRVGWRGAYVALACLAFLVVLPIVLFLRLSTDKLGLYPDGEKPSHFYQGVTAVPRKTNWTMRQVISTPAFWLVILAALGAIGPLRMLTVHQMAAMADAEVNRFTAATIIGFSGLMTAVAFILWGALSDRIGRYKTYTLGSLCLLGAMAILAGLRPHSSAVWLAGYALLLGLGEGSRSSLVTAVASDLFPGSALGAVNGAVGSAFGAGAAIFPWAAGALYDISGSYQTAFQLAGAAILLSLAALWAAPKIHQRNFRQ